MTRLVGPSNSILWITSARLFTANEALEQGAVNYVVSESELLPKALEIANEISKNGPLAVQQAKHAIIAGLDKDVDAGLRLEFECYKNIIPTKDRIEGLNAFKEKREPKYRGE